MIRPEFVHRKLQLIADDLGRLVRFKDETLESLTGDDVKLAAVERMLERIVLRAVDINEHLVSELATGEERTSRIHSLVLCSGAAARSTLGTPSPWVSGERCAISHCQPERLLGPVSPHFCKDGYERETAVVVRRN